MSTYDMFAQYRLRGGARTSIGVPPVGMPSTPQTNVSGRESDVGADLESRYLGQVDGEEGDEDKPKWLTAGGDTTEDRPVVARRFPRSVYDPLGGGLPTTDQATIDVAGRYTEDSVDSEFRTLGPAKRIAVQERLRDAGLLDEFKDGYLDGKTQDALKEVMGWANYTGQRWDSALTEIQSMNAEARARAREEEGRLAKAKQAFVAPTYRAPDYAEMAQAAKQVASDLLDGRELKDYEVKLLADELSGYSRQAYEAEVAGRRSEHDASVRAGETGEDQGGGEVQAVNPMARFREKFEERYAGEIQGEQDEDAAQQTKGALDNVGGMLNGMFGGRTRSV